MSGGENALAAERGAFVFDTRPADALKAYPASDLEVWLVNFPAVWVDEKPVFDLGVYIHAVTFTIWPLGLRS